MSEYLLHPYTTRSSVTSPLLQSHALDNRLAPRYRRCESIDTFAHVIIKRAKAATEAVEKAQRGVYINTRIQDPFGGYGKDNRQEMIKVQREVDPLGVFTSRGVA
jgi:hypothetical protein